MSPLTRRAFLTHTALAALAPSALAETPPRLRIGQIGTAHAHAEGKWEAIRKSPDFEVVGLVENDPALRVAAEKAPAWAGAPWMTETELFAQPGLQAVCVETAVKDLLDTAERCLVNGKHVHLDKPAGESLFHFLTLCHYAAKRRLVLQMGYMFRYHPAFVLCRQLVAESALGEILNIECNMSKDASPAERTALLPYRGGGMFELGCHLIDPIVQMCGRPEKVTAFARASRDDGLLDNQTAVLEYPRTLAKVEVSLTEKSARRRLKVIGSRGVFELDPLEPAQVRLALEEPHGKFMAGAQVLKIPASGGRCAGDFADLAAVLRGEHPFAWSAEHDLAVQETVLRASGLPLS